MQKLVSVGEMQTIESQADAAGLSYAQMMENAGRALAEQVHEVYFQNGNAAFALVGSGNNGGDALVALAYLAEWGWKTGACLVRARDAADSLVQRLIQKGGDVFSLEEDPGYKQLDTVLQVVDVLLDGVLGTGIRLPLKDELGQVLDHVKVVLAGMEEPPWIVAVDCPSGLDCNSGAIADQTLRAQMTVTMAAIKQGMLSLPAYEYLGELRLVGIGSLDGLPAWESVNRFVVDHVWVGEVLPHRPLDAHKGTFGTVLVVAGSLNYTGAALLAGQAAYRVGAGLVTLGVPESLHPALAGHFPEATWLLLPEEKGGIASPAANVIAGNLRRVSAVLLGPGFGLEKPTQEFLDRFLTRDPRLRRQIGFLPPGSAPQPSQSDLPPLVIDADGLKLLAKLPDWSERLPDLAVLTPHPGEMAILTGLSVEELQQNRASSASRYAREWKHVIVLKGAFTAIASPDGRCAFIPVASPALARAGTGDVLAGMIAGLRAQGVPAFEAAAAASWLHAQAGLRAAEFLGNSASVLAGDVLNSIADVISDL
jgi:ADP-dependent NAD(P)H-hydrate dehydratase / NAD(P)H-hydrate epimerase